MTSGDGSWREALVAGAAGTALARWSLRRCRAPREVVVAGAVVAGLNGLVCGRRGTYDWPEPGGVAAFALDSTWGLLGTSTALAVHALQPLHRDADYRPELSRRRNRHVYGGGFALRRGFATTLGNVVTGAAGRAELGGDREVDLRRRQLLDRHEELHVWQNRWFGPLYQLGYLAWTAIGAAIGTLRWTRRRDHSLWSHVEVAAYYENPFERWAYAADDRWPPAAVRRLHGPVAS